MKDREEILRYFLNDRDYIAYIEDNEIKFGKEINGLIDSNLSQIEDFTIRYIYNFIVGKKEDVIILSLIKIDNQQIQVIYNKKNKLYSFFQEKNKHISSLESSIFERLSKIYNDQNLILYCGKENKKSNKFKIITMIGGIVTILFVSGSVVLSTLPLVPNNYNLFNLDSKLDSIYKDSTSLIDNSKYNDQDILIAIDNNKNLSDKEKMLINNLLVEINENINYINVEQVINNISELNIKYNSSIGEYNEVSNIRETIIYQLAGCYTYIGADKNLIELYGDDKHITDSLETSDKSDLFHELNHLLNKRSFIMTVPGKMGNILEDLYLGLGIDFCQMDEMVNELFSCEYLSTFTPEEYEGGYSWLMPPAYALCEIIDNSVMRKYKFDSDNFYITDYLEGIGVNNKDLYDLYKSLDLVYDLANDSESPYATEEQKENYYENNKKIYNIIKLCYEKKYGRSMESDLVMMAYFYKTDYVDEEFNTKFEELIGSKEIEKIIPKGYFSSKYIESNPFVNILTKNDIIVITDETRFVDNIYTSIR